LPCRRRGGGQQQGQAQDHLSHPLDIVPQ
jgi:hypothetical protein